MSVLCLTLVIAALKCPSRKEKKPKFCRFEMEAVSFNLSYL